MSKKTGTMMGKRPARVSNGARSGENPARRSPPDTAAVGKSRSGKVAGTKFNPGTGRPAAKTSMVAPKGGWNTWDDSNAAGAGRSGARREQDARQGARQDEAGEPIVPISPEVAERLRRESLQSLVQSVVVQWSVSVIVALIALLIGGKFAGLSGLLGAACVALPNSLLAFKLLMNSMRPDGGSGSTVLVGEFVKIAAVVLLLVLVVKLGGALIVWPALLAGLIAALKSYWVMLVMASIQRKGS